MTEYRMEVVASGASPEALGTALSAAREVFTQAGVHPWAAAQAAVAIEAQTGTPEPLSTFGVQAADAWFEAVAVVDSQLGADTHPHLWVRRFEDGLPVRMAVSRPVLQHLIDAALQSSAASRDLLMSPVRRLQPDETGSNWELSAPEEERNSPSFRRALEPVAGELYQLLGQYNLPDNAAEAGEH